MQFSKEQARIKREKGQSLQNKLQAAQIQFQQKHCEESEKILDECKTEIEKFYDDKTNGLIVRSRARWHEHGEKSTKYFFKFGGKKPYKETYKEALSKSSYHYQL